MKLLRRLKDHGGLTDDDESLQWWSDLIHLLERIDAAQKEASRRE